MFSLLFSPQQRPVIFYRGCFWHLCYTHDLTATPSPLAKEPPFADFWKSLQRLGTWHCSFGHRAQLLNRTHCIGEHQGATPWIEWRCISECILGLFVCCWLYKHILEWCHTPSLIRLMMALEASDVILVSLPYAALQQGKATHRLCTASARLHEAPQLVEGALPFRVFCREMHSESFTELTPEFVFAKGPFS